MQMLATWIHDLMHASGDQLAWNIRRVLFPGDPYEINDAVIRLEPLTQAAYLPGSYPQGISLLRWIDHTDPPLPRTQQVSEGLCAVLNHVSGSRVELAEEIPLQVEGQSSTLFASIGATPDRSLYGPAPDDLKERFEETLALVASLPEEDLVAIGASMELHYASSLLLEKHLSSAYLLLVSSLEILSRRYGEPPKDFSQWEEQERWTSAFAEVDLTNLQRDRMIDELMADKHLRLGQTFAEYGSKRVADSFWDLEIVEWSFPIHAQQGRYLARNDELRFKVSDILPKNRTLLKRALRRTYSARSGYVHAGRREVDFMADISTTAGGLSKKKPLPYKILRHLVRSILETELRERGQLIELPDIRLTS